MHKFFIVASLSVFLSACVSVQPISEIEKQGRQSISEICVINYMKQGKPNNTARALCSLSLSKFLDDAGYSFHQKKPTIKQNCAEREPVATDDCIDLAERAYWAEIQTQYLMHTR